MLRTQRLARKAAATRPVHRAGPDMALATTVVLFGVFPLVLASGLLLVQFVTAFAH